MAIKNKYKFLIISVIVLMEENSEIKSEKNYFNEDYNIKVDEYHKMKFKSEKEK